MDNDRLMRWLTLLANLGVIFGLAILVLEVQQSNRIATASMEIEVRNSFDDINESIYTDPHLAELLMRLSDAQLTPEEEYRVYVLALSAINTLIGIEVAYDNGLVPETTYKVIEDDIHGWLHDSPGMHRYFQRVYDSIPSQHDSMVFRTIKTAVQEYERKNSGVD